MPFNCNLEDDLRCFHFCLFVCLLIPPSYLIAFQLIIRLFLIALVKHTYHNITTTVKNVLFYSEHLLLLFHLHLIKTIGPLNGNYIMATNVGEETCKLFNPLSFSPSPLCQNRFLPLCFCHWGVPPLKPSNKELVTVFRICVFATQAV